MPATTIKQVVEQNADLQAHTAPGMDANSGNKNLNVDQTADSSTGVAQEVIKFGGEGAGLDIKLEADPELKEGLNSYFENQEANANDFVSDVSVMGDVEIKNEAKQQFKNIVSDTGNIKNENELDIQIDNLRNALEQSGYSMSDFLNANIDQQMKTLDDLRKNQLKGLLQNEPGDFGNSESINLFHNFLSDTMNRNSSVIDQMEVNNNVVPSGRQTQVLY